MRRWQAVAVLSLMVLCVPSAQASWAYCLQRGFLHLAGTACCGTGNDRCCGSCVGGGDDASEAPCCIEAGKVLPDSLAPGHDTVPPPVGGGEWCRDVAWPAVSDPHPAPGLSIDRASRAPPRVRLFLRWQVLLR